MKTAQRVSAVDPSDGFVLARSVLAYLRAAELVYGDVLEIGTGTGYGVSILAPRCRSLVTIDKHFQLSISNLPKNVGFRRMSVPPLDFPDATFDCVVSFQVIEHVRRDRELVAEIARVLRPGGRLVLSTPNRAMSLTRNPWHVREYSPDQLRELLEGGTGTGLRVVEALGVFGGARAMEYYERNRRGVRRWTRWDVLRLREWLPRWLLRAPYDVANRLNRRALAAASASDEASGAASGGAAGAVFTPDDYFFAPAADRAFDLFYIATKNF